MTEIAVGAPVPAQRAEKVARSFDGALLLSGATVVSGVLAYAYHVLAARALGPEAYGLVAVLWAALFLLVVVLYRPLEQTTSRALADRLSRGLDGRSVMRAVALIYVGLAVVILVAAVLAWDVGRDRLFLGDTFFMAALVAGLLAYGVAYVLRGVCGGLGWFRGYAVLLVSDGAVRVAVCAPIVVVASRDLAAAAAVAAAVGSVALPLLVGRRALAPVLAGQQAERFRCRSALAFAWPAAIVAAADQVLVNGGPVLVMLGGGERASTAAAVVFAATMLVRVPVFVFQGLATSLLPNLTRMQAVDERQRFRRALRRASAALAACAVVIVVVAASVGPEAMELVYGPDYAVGRLELALLGVGVGFYLATATFSQGLLALDAGRAAAIGWMASALGFLAAYVAIPGEPLFRVAAAFAIGTALAVPLLGLALVRRGRLG
jgi:O-antigen/teichoic acid export membrane protein